MAGSQVTIALTQIEKQRLGFHAISLTNFSSNTLEPKIAAGSKLESGCALYEFSADETITGWAGIANSGNAYIKTVVAGASITAAWTTTTPTWSTSKQGWYIGGDRVIGGAWKDASGNYAKKWLYAEHDATAAIRLYGDSILATGELTVSMIHAGNIETTEVLSAAGGVDAGASGQALKKKKINIGDWNMDTTVNKVIAHGLTLSKIVTWQVKIIADDGIKWDFNFAWGAMISGKVGIGGAVNVDATNFILDRGTSVDDHVAVFDGEAFDSTPFNRGYIIVEYEP